MSHNWVEESSAWKRKASGNGGNLSGGPAALTLQKHLLWLSQCRPGLGQIRKGPKAAHSHHLHSLDSAHWASLSALRITQKLSARCTTSTFNFFVVIGPKSLSLLSTVQPQRVLPIVPLAFFVTRPLAICWNLFPEWLGRCTLWLSLVRSYCLSPVYCLILCKFNVVAGRKASLAGSFHFIRPGTSQSEVTSAGGCSFSKPALVPANDPQYLGWSV